MQNFVSFAEVEILGFYFDPKGLLTVTIKNTWDKPQIKTTLCLLFNMGGCHGTQTTEED